MAKDITCRLIKIGIRVAFIMFVDDFISDNQLIALGSS
jgi:hypothetical protein